MGEPRQDLHGNRLHGGGCGVLIPAHDVPESLYVCVGRRAAKLSSALLPRPSPLDLRRRHALLLTDQLGLLPLTLLLLLVLLLLLLLL